MTTTSDSTAELRTNNVQVAVMQAAPVLFDTPRSLQKLADLAANAAKQRAETAHERSAPQTWGSSIKTRTAACISSKHVHYRGEWMLCSPQNRLAGRR
jgi:hypothetical protein